MLLPTKHQWVPLTRTLPISCRLILQQAHSQRFNSPPTAWELTIWCAYLNGEEVDYFMIEFVGFKYCINPCYLVVNEMRLMLRLGFQVVLVHVKKSCQDYSKSFIQKLHGKFLNYEFMLSLGVIYLNIWLTTPIMLKIFSSIISLYF
jgi:hypothetical protein